MSSKKTIRTIFRDLSISRKLIGVIALVSAISAFVIGGVLFSYQMYNLRSQFKYHVVSVSEVAADFIAAPVAFNDQAGAMEVLSALKSNEDITHAQIRFRSGEVFAQFGDEDTLARGFPENEVGEFDGWNLYVTRGVLVPNQSVVWLVVAADFKRTFFSSMATMSLAMVVVLLVGVMVSIFAASAFRGVIVGPIIGLADVARKVAEDRNYALRAEILGKDEVGELSHTFNDMLTKVEDSDREVRDAYTKLEFESNERERLQDDLLKTSRMAGMAEVATGVLHNVGNVLNTVNLSVQCVKEQLDASRLTHLKAAVEVIQQQNGHMAEFFTNDPRGKALPDFISKVVDHLDSENSTMKKEMTGLISHVDHIKEIVSTQQSYARVLGVTEKLYPQDLVEDAFRLNSDSIVRHNITLIRDFEEVPEVLVDRHKVVQIIVNLLTNAKDAMMEVHPDDKKITVRLAEVEDDMVAICVTDSGMGIDQETLSSIFNHGFTTKSTGHGFGLHLSALSAQEMGGSLSVDSEGKGCGATFTLTIPAATQPEEA